MKYLDSLIKSMEWLSDKDDTLFIGQSVKYSGNSIFNTLKTIKDKKKLYSTLRRQIDEIQKLKDEIGYVQNPKGDAAELRQKHKKGGVWNPPEMEDEYNRLLKKDDKEFKMNKKIYKDTLS